MNHRNILITGITGQDGLLSEKIHLKIKNIVYMELQEVSNQKNF